MNITKEGWAKIIGAVLLAIATIAGTLLGVDVQLQNAQVAGGGVVASQGMTERINLDSFGDNQISNGGDLTFWSGARTGQTIKLTGDTGAISATTYSVGGVTFSGPIKYGSAATYTSGSSITHGFATTPTMCIILPVRDVTSTVTITATGFSSDMASLAIPIRWLCGQ